MLRETATLVSLTLISSISFANDWGINKAGLTGAGFIDSSGKTWSYGSSDNNDLGQLAGTTQIYSADGTDFMGYASMALRWYEYH